jgi:hypothetical protein
VFEEVEDVDNQKTNGYHEQGGKKEDDQEDEDEQEEEIKEEDIVDEEFPSEKKKRRGPQRKTTKPVREKRIKKEISKSALQSPMLTGDIAAEVTVDQSTAPPVTTKSYVFSTAMANRAGYHVHKGTYPTVIAYHEAQEWAMPYLTSEVHCKPFNEELEMLQVKKEEVETPSKEVTSPTIEPPAVPETS